MNKSKIGTFDPVTVYMSPTQSMITKRISFALPDGGNVLTEVIKNHKYTMRSHSSFIKLFPHW
jgi:hypothetical protein